MYRAIRDVAGDVEDDAVEVACEPSTRWRPGQASFTEVTEAWGLVGVMGTRVNAVDDGDGWSGLLATRGAQALGRPGSVYAAADVSVRWPDAGLTSEQASLVGGERYEWAQGAAPQAVE